MSKTSPNKSHLLDHYEKYLSSRDTVGFVLAVSRQYAPGTLQRLAEHPDLTMRCAAVFALGYIGDFEVNHTLGRALQDDDNSVRLLAGMACRSVWNRDGNQGQRQQLADTIRLNATRQYQEAVQLASTLLDDFPGFAEAWYQRGAAWFQLDDFSQAIRDFDQALELNPYQFVAAAAIGQAHLRLGTPAAALDAFRRALRLNPEVAWVQDQVTELARQVGNG